MGQTMYGSLTLLLPLRSAHKLLVLYISWIQSVKTYIGDIADSVCVTTGAYIFIIIIRQTYIQTYRSQWGKPYWHMQFIKSFIIQ